MNTVYIVFYREIKGCNCEIFGVFKTKYEAIKSLLGFITDNHNPLNCKNSSDQCDQCEYYNDAMTDLINKNQTEETYEIIEKIVDKKWYV